MRIAAPDTPLTITLATAMVLIVTDGLQQGDEFELFDFGASIGSTFIIQQVPEPGTLALLGIALAASPYAAASTLNEPRASSFLSARTQSDSFAIAPLAFRPSRRELKRLCTAAPLGDPKRAGTARCGARGNCGMLPA